MKAKDPVGTAAFRSALAAIDNAGAVEAIGGERPALGIGARDLPRRELTEEHVAEIVGREVFERREAAADYESRGRAREARRLRDEATALEAVLLQD